MPAILTVAEMGQADAAAIAAGTPGRALMERAGSAVAEDVCRRCPEAHCVLVLAGPGNNGGDGYVAARHLAELQRDVTVAAYVDRKDLRGDAAEAAAAWQGVVKPLHAIRSDSFDVVVDALFGAGLVRPIDEDTAQLLRAIEQCGRPIIAVDIPSGVSGDSGAVLGQAMHATSTVTFVRRKPGHLLFPGRQYCGEVTVADIGIPDSIVDGLRPRTHLNVPAAWAGRLPVIPADGHKYSRGHVLVVSGPALATGASRLAARAALRAGAGLVTLAGAHDALLVHASHMTAVMLAEIREAADLGRLLDDKRYNVVVLGPGAGVAATTRAKAIETMERHRALVLDADGISVFQKEVPGLAAMIRANAAPVVLTPHEGEFARLFKGISQIIDSDSKLERARAAAAMLGAVMVLKGADTVVAAPDGRATIAANAPPTLATAGAGDVLAGIVAGLLAQGMPAFEAASAAVWVHGEAAADFGVGLIAEDLPDRLPAVLRRIKVGS